MGNSKEARDVMPPLSMPINAERNHTKGQAPPKTVAENMEQER
jgi:hypothetical protein